VYLYAVLAVEAGLPAAAAPQHGQSELSQIREGAAHETFRLIRLWGGSRSPRAACGEAATTYWGITSLEGSGASLKGSDLFSGIRRALAASRTVDPSTRDTFLSWQMVGDG
jgi:hypothetical protein